MIGPPIIVPQDVLDEFMPYVRVSDLISTLTIDNIDEIFNQVLEEHMGDTEIGINAIVMLVYIRNIKYSLQFLKRLFELCQIHASPQNYFGDFKIKFIEHLLRSTSNYLYFRNTKDFRFLRLLTDNGSIDFVEYESQLYQFTKTHKDLPNVILTLSVYFDKYIKNEPEFYAKLQKYVARAKVSDKVAKKFPQLYDKVMNSEELFNQYLEHGCEVGSLEYILKNDDIDAFMLYKNSVFNINKIIKRNYLDFPSTIRQEPSIIQYAVYYGSVKIFKYLIVQNPKLDYKDKWDHYLQYFAVTSGNIELVRLVQQQNLKFEGYLKIAAQYSKKDIFNWILETQIQSEDRLKIEMINTLCYSCSSVQPNTILWCLQNGCDTNSIDSGGYGPLQSAVISNVQAILIFISKIPTTQIDRKDSNGETALHMAIKYGDTAMAKYLLEHGADPNLVDNNGYNSVRKALEFKQTENLKLLVNYENIDIGNPDLLIQHAVFGHNMFCMEFILEHPSIFNVNKNVVDFSMPPIIMFARSDKYKLIKLMLKYDHVDKNARDNLFNMNFFQNAIETKSYNTIRLAVQTDGVDYYTPTRFGNTLKDLVGDDETIKEILRQANINLEIL
ncbi:hypothetical protein TVAG_011170 [Trichomonas vaginalis G3]|uniref:Uncharacterized protein n=1 Tax=Trichomonas vaginalis (strain ATCC PRA-98 / G3) TaxID=412133 RepID=A2DP42_TRIV3|nr:spectrin binding [Trichomonas vaginalis G3]EAY17891.1 hypothetical protein TVAG_011170 [Trichomonas vaginalis G3]KAI5489891.1 spectrin binding [Trichomonas vaginalis G3]|eukprot:XP_001330026.1 hypothetical protein [Trichomonas vaginalis G3]